MSHEEQISAIERVRALLPRGVALDTTEVNEYGDFEVTVRYGEEIEYIVLEGYNKTYCAKRILNSYPVEKALA